MVTVGDGASQVD